MSISDYSIWIEAEECAEGEWNFLNGLLHFCGYKSLAYGSIYDIALY